MAKWQSVLFSDIRNKLGNQVVFSSWKGRGYLRSYAKPSNPNTAKQRATRLLMKAIVQHYKSVVDTPEKRQIWNDLANELQISGYNLFVKEGTTSEVSVPSTASGTGSATITVTYSIGFSPADAILVVLKPDGTYEDITPAEGLQASGTVDYTATASGDYVFFIGDKRAIVEGDTAPRPYQLVTKYSKDTVAGTIKEAKCTATIS